MALLIFTIIIEEIQTVQIHLKFLTTVNFTVFSRIFKRDMTAKDD